jgi:uncharacterized protein (TIGR03067 family)
LVSSAVKAAGLFAAGQTAATGAISVKVAALTEGVLKAMFITKLKMATAVLVAVALVAGGIGALSSRTLQGQEHPDPAKTQPQPDAKTDLQRLHGAWSLVEMETRGKRLTGKDMIYPFDSGNVALKSLKLVFDTQSIHQREKFPADKVSDANDRLGGVEMHFSGSRPEKGEFLLNETKKPKRIAMAWFLMYWESIYKLDGDTLTICFNPRTSIRPDDFRTAADSDQVIYVFKREKPAQDKKGQGVDQRPDLSGIQIVPETKKPDANQKKTDPSTPDATPGPGKKPVSYIKVEVKGILNLPGASGDITTTIATKEGTLELEFLSGPGIPKIEGPRGAELRKLDGELVVVTGALRIESRPRGQAVVVRVASVKAAE